MIMSPNEDLLFSDISLLLCDSCVTLSSWSPYCFLYMCDSDVTKHLTFNLPGVLQKLHLKKELIVDVLLAWMLFHKR